MNKLKNHINIIPSSKIAFVLDDGNVGSKQSFGELLDISKSIDKKMIEILKYLDAEHQIVFVVDVLEDIYLPAILYTLINQENIFVPISFENIDKVINIVKKSSSKYAVLHKSNMKEFRRSVCDLKILYEDLTPNHALIQVNSYTENTCVFRLSSDHAYMMCTSGTTGEPKLVAVTHHCILPNLQDFKHLFQVTSNDVILIPSSLTFDASLLLLLLSLSSKCTALMFNRNVRQKPHQLCLSIKKNSTTVMQCTPSFLLHMGVANLKKYLFCNGTVLRILAVGGERFISKDMLMQLAPQEFIMQVFNLYGVTQMSAWASIKEIQTSDLIGLNKFPYESQYIKDWVPIGVSLTDTSIKLKDHGTGTGEILIGSCKRNCLVEDGTDEYFIKTGDIGIEMSGNIYYCGRKNSLIKRHGLQISMNSLEVVLASHDVNSYAVFDENDNTLCLYITKQSRQSFLNTKLEVIKIIKTQLTSAYIPDKICFIDFLPITENGKINRKKLRQTQERESIQCLNFEFIERIWMNLLSLNRKPMHSDSFILSGGDSFTAVLLANQIIDHVMVGKKEFYEELLKIILHTSYKDVIDFIIKHYDGDLDVGKNHLEGDFFSGHHIHVSVWKNIEISDINNVCRNANIHTRQRFTKRHRIQRDIIREDNQRDLTSKCITYKELWKTDLQKCIDASPLVVANRPNGGVVYIGSHSHLFSAISLNNGEILWQRLFPSRIESSAAITANLQFVCFGCYDGYFYILHSDNGNTYWAFKTSDQIKCTPTVLSLVQPEVHLVFFGSHDHHFYALDILSKELTWDLYVGASCVSSPLVTKEKVFSAFLNGNVICCLATSGKIVWMNNLKKSVFSSLYSTETYLLCGCVDGFIYAMNYDSGIIMWKYQTRAPIFSSPVSIMLNEERIFMGSNNGLLYCLTHEGSCVWTFQGGSPFYSTPTIIGDTCMVAVTTKGRMFLIDTESGSGCPVYRFPQDVFSSPIYANNRIVIGCRDNHLYCFQL